MGNSQQDFEHYQAEKYKAWKGKTSEEQKKEEQKAFDDYVKSATENAKTWYLYETSKYADAQFAQQTASLNKDRNVYEKAKTKTIAFQSTLKFSGTTESEFKSQVQPNDIIYLREQSTNGLYRVSKILYKDKDSRQANGYIIHSEIVNPNTEGGGSTVVVPTFDEQCVATASSVESTEQPSVTVTLKQRPEHQVGTNNKQFNFDFKIPKGKDGASGGGGGVQPITPAVPIEPQDKVLGTVEGKFAVNLFNYREMSRDGRFGISGKTFNTKGRQQILYPEVLTSDDSSAKRIKKEKIKTLTPYNRIRTGEDFYFDAKKFHDLHPILGREDIKMHIHTFNRQDDLTTIDINPTYNPEHAHQKTNFAKKIGFGYLRVDIGGDGKPAKGAVELEAWYGTDEHFRPEGDKQDFTFLKHNGIELKANHKGVKDEYKHTRWADFVDIKLNVLNLKDAELLKVHDIEESNNNMLYIKCPSDMWYPDKNSIPTSSSVDQTIEKYIGIMNDNFMSNNLCDITQREADDAPFGQDKPFFVKAITEVPHTLPTGETANYKCFQILIGKENMSKWREHLSQTQIMYLTQRPDKNTETGNDKVEWVQLPTGGMIYTLNSGQVIETNKYGKLSNLNLKQHKSRGLKFSNSPFGYPDLIIDSDSIASVVLTPLPDDFSK